jgi:hypothetical protein
MLKRYLFGLLAALATGLSPSTSAAQTCLSQKRHPSGFADD